MNKKIIIIIVVLVVVLLVGGVGYDYYTNVQAQVKMAEEKAQQEQMALEQKQQAEAEEMKRLKCVDGENFSIVTRDHKDSVGQDVLVKTKGATADKCEYMPADGDFELTNGDPQYYKAQIANSLLTDVGTGPSGRSFRLYDLKDKNMVVEKQYFDELTISSSTLTYFGLSKTKADKKNCKDGNLVVKKTIDLKTYSAKETKETKCVANQ